MNKMTLLNVVIDILSKLVSLRGQCNTPLHFELCALDFCVSHNRMSTFLLQNKSLFKCLFNCTINYGFLSTFECLCFLFFLPYNAHKLVFSSFLFVFLGYSSSHLDYHWLNMSSQCIYIFCHVRFHEHAYPFDKSE